MTLLATILLVGLASGDLQPESACRAPVVFDAATIQVGTGGTWRVGDRYGRFRYFVFAAGSEHTTHTVQVEILEYVTDPDQEGRVEPRVVGCVSTGALTEKFVWWVESIRIDIVENDRSLLRIKLAYAENDESVRDHVLELRRDGRLRVVQEAWPRP